jgi:hypothetical protein
MADTVPVSYGGRTLTAQVVTSATGGTAAAPTYTQDVQNTYTLASNASLAAGTTNATTPVSGIKGGSYIFAYQFTQAATVSLILEALGPDGTTYQTISSLSATSGTVGIVLGENSTVRLRNGSGTNAVSALYANLS